MFDRREARDTREPYLYDSRFVEDRIPGWLVAFHVPQYTAHTDVLGVDQTEGSDIDEIVLEVLEVEGLDILEKGDRRVSSGSPTPRGRCPSYGTYESREEIVVLVVVHLQLQDLKVSTGPKI